MDTLNTTDGLKPGDKLRLDDPFGPYNVGDILTVDIVLTDFKLEVRENKGWLRVDRFSRPGAN